MGVEGGGVGAQFVLAQFFPRPSFPTTMESSSGWCSTCFASKCRCSSTSRGEDKSHHGARANHKGKHQGGFSGVQETSFNIQSCSYQAARGHHQPIFQVSAKESHCLEKRNFVNCFTITRGWDGELHFVEPSGGTYFLTFSGTNTSYRKGFEVNP